MKTTLNINDTLLIEAKSLAARQRTSLTRLIEEGLRMRLRAKAVGAGAASFRLPVMKGKGGMLPSIDPTSNKSLLAAAGDDDA
jgi:hypothetical protein